MTTVKIYNLYFGADYNPNVLFAEGSSITRIVNSNENAGILIYPNPVKTS